MFPDKYRVLPIGFLLLLLTGCGNEGDARPSPVKNPEKTAQVEIAAVTTGDLQETFTLPGTLEAWENLTLAAEYAGPVRWIGPDEGDRVKSGKAILSIDDDTLQANLTRDRTAFEVSSKELERYRKLLSDQLVSQQEFDTVRSRLEADRAKFKQSEITLEKSSLKSPISGILDRLHIDRGEYVSPGDPLATIVRVDRMKLIVDVPEKDVSSLFPGQTVTVLTADLVGGSDLSLPGKILHVGYQADPASRTFRVKVEVVNPELKLRPGMILRARFLRKAHHEVVSIPLYALVKREGKMLAFVAQEGLARQRPVELGPVISDRVIITSGLSPGDELIVKGQQLLTDGSNIEISHGSEL